MSGYLVSVVGTVLISTLLIAILPEGKTSKTVQGIAKCVCLLAIVAPIPNLLQSIEFDEKNFDEHTIFPQTVIQTDEDFITYYSEMRIRVTQNDLRREIQEKFSLSATVVLDWEMQTEGVRITKITVRTEGEWKEVDKTAVWEFLRNNYCSEVLIE